VFAYDKEIRSLASTLSERIMKAGKKSVAVVDFVDLQGSQNELGRFLAEELSVHLINQSQGFEVLDRNHMKAIITEHKFNVSGMVDRKDIKEFGQITGAEVIITGSTTPFGDNIRVTCKALATDTARIIGAASEEIARTKTVDDLQNTAIGKKNEPSPQKAAGQFFDVMKTMIPKDSQ